MIETLILAIVQGIAEFLPISSSGHLVILGAIMNALTGQVPAESPTMEIILHTGTLGSILVVFWKRIVDLIGRNRRVILLMIVGTIPAVVVGLPLKKLAPDLLTSPLLAGSMLIVTGALLIALGKMPIGKGNYSAMTLAASFLVGCFQAFAILPGISRSGSTILGGRLIGLKTDDAVTFSFLLAIPAIAGASVLELKDLYELIQAGEPLEYSVAQLAIGAAVSFLVGIAALKWLIGWAAKERLSYFAYWCIPVGAATILLCLTGTI